MEGRSLRRRWRFGQDAPAWIPFDKSEQGAWASGLLGALRRLAHAWPRAGLLEAAGLDAARERASGKPKTRRPLRATAPPVATLEQCVNRLAGDVAMMRPIRDETATAALALLAPPGLPRPRNALGRTRGIS